MKKSYGINKQETVSSSIEEAIEAIRLRGFSVLEKLIPDDKAKVLSEKLDRIYQQQEKAFGTDRLTKIQEENVARCPLVYEDEFLELATQPVVREIMGSLLGDYHILHLQNGIINRPDQLHHQTSWHRDLPYQNYVSSSPLAISALWCLDDFSIENGGTTLIPGSHKMTVLPSDAFIEKESVTLEAPAGSVLIFDSMVFHRAGENISNTIRRGVNNVYSIPLIKQQINIPKMLGDRFDPSSEMGIFLGYDSQVPESVEEYRKRREARSQKSEVRRERRD